MQFGNVLVLGLGKSGKEVALLLKKKGARVAVVDADNSSTLQQRRRVLKDRGITVILGSENPELLKEKDYLVLSPGVPLTNSLVREALSRNIPVVSELEIASRFFPGGNLIGITGTNGKSTTAILTYRMLKKGKIPVRLGGNIGIPLSRIARENHGRYPPVVVTEVSSFQLETTTTFSPHIYCILNIEPDHLDRHTCFARYRDLKVSPLFEMGKEDFAFLNYDDASVISFSKATKAKVIFFSKNEKLERGVFIEENKIVSHVEEKESCICLQGLSVRRFHNWENVLCATGIALLKGVNPETIKETLMDYKPLSHRQQIVARVAGVTFIDDSKATNESAVKALLKSLETPALLIMGGKDKGADFSSLRNHLADNIKAIFLIGEAKNQIKKDLKGTVPLEEAESLGEAVRKAFSQSREGDSIILCPGCSSFDSFINYKHRGNVFQKEVKKLEDELKK